MKKIFRAFYCVFERCFGFLYHPIIRFLRFNGYSAKDFYSYFMFYILSIKKNSDEKKLYLDVTYLSKCERFAGICRVVSKIKDFLPLVQSDYELVPVVGKQYLGFYRLDDKQIIVPTNKDIFLSAEVTQGIVDSNNLFFRKIQKKGCGLYFFLHDLIPVLYPEFNGSMKFFRFYQKFLKQLALSDGIICNSNSVLNDFNKYLSDNNIKTNPNIRKSFTHLGVDFKEKKSCVTSHNNQITFLMVSTVEVRKMYDQAVMAFDQLWKKGVDVRLNIVGKYGWRAEKAKQLIEENSELGKKLFWYNTGISDEELTGLYQNCDAVIFASKTEGFGLALIEAAIYKRPLIIRDIPIFREVAGENAFYFAGNEPEDISEAVEKWLELYKSDKHPSSEGIKHISWEECVKNIYQFITDRN